MAKIFEGGIPYEPDLVRLDIVFPSLKPGDRIDYESIGNEINAKWPSSRFKGVVTAWRHRLTRDRGLHTDVDPKNAIVILNADQATNLYMRKQYRPGIRSIAKSSRSLSKINRSDLDEVGQKKLDAARYITAKSAAALFEDIKELPKDWLPPKSLPKPRLVGISRA